MGLKFISKNRSERSHRKSDKEKIADLKLGKETARVNGKDETVCNLTTVADYLEVSVSQIENWLHGTTNKQTGKVYPGLFGKYGEHNVNLLVGVVGFVKEEGKRGRKAAKSDMDLIAEIAALQSESETSDETENAAA